MAIDNSNSSFSTSRGTSPTSSPTTELLQHRVRELEKELLVTREHLESKKQELNAIQQEHGHVIEKLSHIQNRYKSIFDYGMTGIAVYEVVNDGRDFIIRDFNQTAEKIENVTKQAVLGKNVKEVFPGIEDMGLLNVFRRVWKTRQSESFPVVKYADRRINGWRENFVFLSSDNELIAVYQDVTNLMQIREEMHLKNELIDLCKEGISIADATLPDCPVIYINQGFETITGYSKAEVLGLNMRFLQGPLTDKGTISQLHQAVHQGHAITVEILNYRKDGSEFWNRVAMTPMHDEDGKLTCFISIHTDISEQKHAQEALRLSEERFRTLTVSSPVGIYLADADGRCQYINEKWCEIAGLTAEQAMGDGWKDGLYHEDRNHLADLWDQMVKAGNQWGSEYRFENSKGEITWVYGHAMPFYDDHQKLLGYVGSNVDITKLKEAEEALRSREEQFRAVANYTYDWETWFDPTGKAVWINPAVQRITGYSIEECLSMANYPLPIVINDDRTVVSNILKQGLAGQSGNNQLFRIQNKQGGIQWVAISWQPIFDKNRISLGIRTSIRDVDAQVKAENQLQKERYRLAKCQEIGHIGTWEFDLVANRLIWTQENYRIFGVPETEKLSYGHFLESVHPDDRESVNMQWQAALQGNAYDIEHRIVSEGKIKWVREKAELVFNDQGIAIFAIGVTQDITTLKNTEHSLKLSKKKYHLLFETMVSGFAVFEIIFDRNGCPVDCRFIEINPAFETISGLKKEAVIGKTVKECLPELEDFWIEIFGRNSKTGISSHFERYVDALGFWFRGWAYCPRPGFVAVTFEDITTEKTTQITLQLARERFKLAMDAVTEGLWDWDIQSGTVYYSPVWAEIIGEECVGNNYMSWESRLFPEDKPATLTSLEEHFQGKTPSWHMEYRLLTQSGDWKWVLGRGRVIARDEKGNPLRMIGTMKDISQRKALEDQMSTYRGHLRALNSRISSIESQERRRIAEEVHDRIVQPLIFLDIQLSRLIKISGHDSMQTRFTEMRTTLSELIQISRDITCDLSSPLLYELGLDAAVEEWLEQKVRREHKLDAVFSAEVPTRKMTPEINELLYKCVKELTVNTIKHAKASGIKVVISEESDYVRLSVMDNGIGFQEERPEREMNGFGLFNICEKVQYMGGSVNIDSSADSGSRIIIKIPIKNT